MGTVLQSVFRHGSKSSKRERLYSKLLYEYIDTKGSGFLLCPDYVDICEHEWKFLDYGFTCCRICGLMHDCNDGSCPEISVEGNGKVCSITGCVTSEGEFREERHYFDRVGLLNVPRHVQDLDNHPEFKCDNKSVNDCTNREKVKDYKKTRQKYTCNGFRNETTYNMGFEMMTATNMSLKSMNFRTSTPILLSVFNNESGKFCETVQSTVIDILYSDKTHICFLQEIKRNENKIMCMFSKMLRDCLHDKACLRPNMLDLFGQVYYTFQKHRLVYKERDESRDIIVKNLVKTCTESISNLLLKYGGLRVARQMQNSLRCREFICSMLYLMRMGITYKNRQLLPKLEILNEYLPMQVLLPVIFQIRAKSITEGENIIKLDIRQMPLI